MRKLKRQNRFCTAIAVGTARCDAVAAPPGIQIGQHGTTVVSAKEPAIGRARVIDPALRRIGTIGTRGGLDSRLRFQRLLIKGQGFMGMAESVRTDGPKLPGGRDLHGGDPAQAG